MLMFNEKVNTNDNEKFVSSINLFSTLWPALFHKKPFYVVPWCSRYHYCTTSFNKVSTQVLRRLKSCSRCVGDSRWWEFLTIVPAWNKAKRCSSVNHTTKTIHHHHHNQGLLSDFVFFTSQKNFFRNYRNNKSNIQLLNELNFCPGAVKRLINKSKSNYYERIANKLNNLQRNRNSKPCWSLLCFLKYFFKCFLNNNKITLTELFSSFSLKQCFLINNGSILPTHEITYHTWDL